MSSSTVKLEPLRDFEGVSGHGMGWCFLFGLICGLTVLEPSHYLEVSGITFVIFLIIYIPTMYLSSSIKLTSSSDKWSFFDYSPIILALISLCFLTMAFGLAVTTFLRLYVF